MISLKAAVALAAGVLVTGGAAFPQAPALTGAPSAGPLASCWSYTNAAVTIGYGGCNVVAGWERWRLGVKCTTRSANHYSAWQYASLTKSYLCPSGGRVSNVWTDSQS